MEEEEVSGVVVNMVALIPSTHLDDQQTCHQPTFSSHLSGLLFSIFVTEVLIVEHNLNNQRGDFWCKWKIESETKTLSHICYDKAVLSSGS
jgi:hypothetical protein